MQIYIKDDSLIAYDVGYHYHEMRALGMTWDRKSQSLQAPVGESLLQALATKGLLPETLYPKLEALKAKRLRIAEEATSTRPLFDYPVRAKLYRHQMRGANMAMMAFLDDGDLKREVMTGGKK